MILKNAYLSLCLLWNHTIASLQKPKLWGLNPKLWLLLCASCLPCPPCHPTALLEACALPGDTISSHTTSQFMTLSTLLQWEKNTDTDWAVTEWETPYTPWHPCLGTVNSSRERAGSWCHRHLKIAATKSPEFKSKSSWCFQQKSPSKA